MDHVVYVDAKEDELGKLQAGSKSMIIRGATGHKLPYGRVQPGDWLYFVPNDGLTAVRARARVAGVEQQGPLTPEDSKQAVESLQGELQLGLKMFQRWAGKRYLVLMRVADFEALSPFRIDRGGFGNMDDWLPVGQIDSVRLELALE